MYVAGEAAVAASGLKDIELEDLVRLKVIDPLGLENTGFSPINMRKKAPKNHARAFYAKNLLEAQEGIFQQQGLDESYCAAAAAGDMYSNVLDLVKWGKAVIEHGSVEDEEGELEVEREGKKFKRRQVLNKKSVQETLTPKILTPAASPRTPEFSLSPAYGYGWGIGSYKGQTMYRHCKLLVFFFFFFFFSNVMDRNIVTHPSISNNDHDLFYSFQKKKNALAGLAANFSSNICMFPDSDLVIALGGDGQIKRFTCGNPVRVDPDLYPIYHRCKR